MQEGETATDTFSYTVSDGQGGTDTAMVTITISGLPNDPPVASDDAYETDESMRLIVPAPGLLANDSDPDASDVLSVKSLNTSGTMGLVVCQRRMVVSPTIRSGSSTT